MQEKVQSKLDASLEHILSSKSRVKIIRILSDRGELNISEIARQCRLNHNTCQIHLDILKDAKILQEKRFGRIKIYRIRTENMKIMALKNLFDLWNKF